MAYNPGMIQPTQVGIREELADYIANVDAKSTPLTSMIPKGKDLGNQQFSWQVDDYAATKAGGVADGADVTFAADATSNASANRTRLYNLAQAFRRVHRTGFIADTSNVAGLGDETAKGIAKRMVEMKRDIEDTIASTNQNYFAGNNAPLGTLTSSLGTWLTTNVASGLGAPTSGFETPAASRPATNTSNITETVVQDLLASIYGETGVYRDYDAIVGTTLKRAFTQLCDPKSTTNATANTYTQSSVRTFNKELSSNVYSSSIDVFEGDFGTIRIHPTTFIGNTNGSPLATSFTAQPYKGYILPMEMLELRYAKLPEVKELPDAGGGPARLVQAICGLVVKNPSGMGMFNAVN